MYRCLSATGCLQTSAKSEESNEHFILSLSPTVTREIEFRRLLVITQDAVMMGHAIAFSVDQ